MEFEEPLKTGFTIYSKSGCINCNKVKNLIKEKNFLFALIECDEYVLEEKTNFLLFIREKANVEVKTFPMVFYENKFIGGFSETEVFINKNFLSFEENLIF
jgi:glutaredoxin